MDKAVLKKFAIESRQDLMQRMENKIKTFYIDEEFSKQQNGDVYILANNKHSLNLSKEEYTKRELLIKRINELGLEQVIEESAYTWFNRIVAIRYMEIHDYLPLTRENQSLGIRVLSSKDNTPDPEIMKFTNLVNPELDIDFKKEKYVELKDDNEKFKYILLLVCKKLGRVIPQVFDGVTDYINILIPDNLLNESGFVNKIITEVPEENYEQVEIIGWLYQYYNQIEKDRVISNKKAYKENEIAYATQLFTPDWIVKYMVDNTIGNLLTSESKSQLKYLIKNEQNNYDSITKIKFLDPCCGSGHILVYAFEVFFKLYLDNGYNKKDIVGLILKNNIFGMDVDNRASQLAILSVVLKAREYDKDIFNKDIIQDLNIISIQESKTEYLSYIDELHNDKEKEQVRYLFEIFKNGKETGSLTKVRYDDYKNLESDLNSNNTILGYELRDKVIPLIKQAKLLSEKYDYVVTNPPYLTSTAMTQSLKKYINKNYNFAKNDMFSAFIVNNFNLCKDNGSLGFMTPYVWMFISSYEELRKFIINNMRFESLIQLEYSALEEAVVPLCTFVMKKNVENKEGTFFRLVDFTGGMKVQEERFLKLKNNPSNEFVFYRNNNDFKMIPTNTISYWIQENTIKNFEEKDSIKKIVKSSVGIQTGDNDKFLHYWWEVDFDSIAFNIRNVAETFCNKKWYPYNKGGEYRKWSGNDEFVINWKDDGSDIKKNSEITGHHYQQYVDELKFKQQVTWSRITSGTPSFRYKNFGYLSDMAGFSIYSDEVSLKKIIAFCNSNVAKHYLSFMAPTLNIMIGSVISLPYSATTDDSIRELVEENIKLTSEDWNSFEISWNFLSNPLLCDKGKTLRINFDIYKKQCDSRFNKLKENEETINEYFINDYHLDKEVSKEVNDKEVSIRKANLEKNIKSLISYSVGCMFGRYSLDKDGLIYAGGDFDNVYQKYKKTDGDWAGSSLSNYKYLNDNGNEIELSFEVDNDNIIPITDETYFSDDIVERFKTFIKTVYGDNTFNENMDFIAEILGKKGTETSEETIRRYFVNDFFNDHCKIYQKRPIYWLLDSGKKNGFKALIYMHRYNENLIPKARLDYLHRIQSTYEKLLSDVNYKLTTDLSMVDKKDAQKRQADLNAKLQEIKEYDEKIAHIANQRISIDLDDGVKTNYEKFKDILAKIK